MTDLQNLTPEDLSNLCLETESQLRQKQDEVRCQLEAINEELDRREDLRREQRNKFVFEHASELIKAFDIQHIKHCNPDRPATYAESCIRCALEYAILAEEEWFAEANDVFQDHDWTLGMKVRQ